jgi:predicted transposase/invertase (TIGR01784 family)
MGLLPIGFDLLPPSDDRVFKLILISPNAKPALMDLISVIIKRPVTDVVVRNNELPASDIDKKAERLDVNCRIDDGSQVDLEMQASYIEELSGGYKNLKGKSIYYLCDLHSSQPSKGRQYDELVQTYQVTFCSYTIFPEMPDYISSFSMRHDTTNELLSDAIRMIYVELSKLKEILKKSVREMTDLEKWAIFLRYADVPAYRDIVNKVIESKEELQMAGELLMSISQNERERAIYRSRRMFQSDLESNIATAEARGEARGKQIGLDEGRQMGLDEGRQMGLDEGRIAIARNLLQMNVPLDQIVVATGLTPEIVEALHKAAK